MASHDPVLKIQVGTAVAGHKRVDGSALVWDARRPHNGFYRLCRCLGMLLTKARPPQS